MSKKYYKCLDCLFKKKNGYCIKRSLMTDYKLIRAWGCDDYKPKYESLLDEKDN